MIDISKKKTVERAATAQGKIRLKAETIKSIKGGNVKKGDVMSVAEVATLSAVKKTAEALPHCHNIPLEHVSVEFELTDSYLLARVSVKAIAKTGVEMEALVGVTTALCTVWDMIKYLEKDSAGQYPDTQIYDVRVTQKRKKENAQAQD